MKIGIYTTFYNIDPAYSLCSVVLDQLTALTKHGHTPVLFVLPSFKDEAKVPEGVEVRKVVPQLILEPYKGLSYPDHWKADVASVKEYAEKNLGDITHLICHDIFFIDTFLPYNIGLREALPQLPELKIFAWTHSAPSTRPNLEENPHANRFILNSDRIKLVYLNHDKVTALAEMYGAWDKDVRVVRNSRDPRTFWNLHPFVHGLIDNYDLFEADFISIYPLSTPRMITGKGLDKAIRLHAGLKKLGYKTRLIVCNAHANASPEQRMIAETMVWAANLGITHRELVFTSQVDEKYRLGVPQNIVSDLFRISNLFVFPTYSENSSLVLLEAMLSGCLLVLNKDVGTLREHAGDSALYVDFSYRNNEKETEIYFLDLAKIVASQFEVSKPLQAKRRAFQQFNYDVLYRNLEVLFYE